jgi:hypothetical protein
MIIISILSVAFYSVDNNCLFNELIIKSKYVSYRSVDIIISKEDYIFGACMNRQ